MMKKCFVIVMLLLLPLSCVQREEGLGIRDNPCDPGGANWTVDALPELAAAADSLWADFNHTDSTGALQLALTIDDLNFPFDTLAADVFIGTRRLALPQITIPVDTALMLDKLKAAAAYRCSTIVADARDGIVSKAFTLTTSASLPPLPPRPAILSGTNAVTIKWQPVTGAASYTIHTSSKSGGPFRTAHTINQPQSGVITVIDTPSGYAPRYYRFASHNSSGTSFLPDTLTGRIYYPGITAPSFSSVSKGSYQHYIQLCISTGAMYSGCLEIHRSIADTFSFQLIDTMRVSSSYSIYRYVNDSVATADTCFYRMIVVDEQGRCSRPGVISYGYLQRINAPYGVSLTAFNDYLRLTWYSNAAAYYKVYRSDKSCSENMALLDSTTSLSINDTTPASGTYFYVVRCADVNGRESAGSACVSGRIRILPAPTGCQASSALYLHHIALSWNTVEGAAGYIITRGTSSDSAAAVTVDTVFVTSCNDTVENAITYYYRVAAFNLRGTGLFSSVVTGVTILPPLMTVVNAAGTIRLSWPVHSRAIAYYLYRSEDSTGYTLLDSTTDTSYTDTPADYRKHYYRLSIMTQEGKSGLGGIAAGQCLLAPPSGFTATDRDDGVLLAWNRVEKAQKYRLYRSSTTGNAILYKELADTFCLDTIASANRYYYWVTVVADETESRLSAVISGGRIGVPQTPTLVAAAGKAIYIQLSWSMPASSSTPQGFYIYRSLSSGGTFTCIDTTADRTYNDTVFDTLRYYYKIAAFNAMGTSTPTSAYYATCLRLFPPSNVQASQGTMNRGIRLTWSPVESVSHYDIYRSSTSGATRSIVGSAVGTTDFSDTTCSSNTAYYYVVVSQRTDGMKSGPSLEVSGFRLGPPALGTVSQTSTSITISWREVPYAVQMYNIYRSNSAGGPFTKISGTKATLFTDSLPLTGNNFYKVSVLNGEESAVSLATLSANLLLPAPPSAITATQGTAIGFVRITWTGGSSVTGYRLYRAPTDTFDRGIVMITQTLQTSYNDSTGSDSIFFYKVKSFNANGESRLCDSIARGYRSPAKKAYPPTNVYIWPQTDKIFIGWEESSTAVGYSGYRVFRSTSADGPLELIAETGATFFEDIPPERSPAVYWYTITARNQLGDSAPSAAVSGSRN